MIDSQRLEAALLSLTHSVQTLAEQTRITNTNINNLIEHLYTRNDVVALDVVDVKNELYEFKEVFKQQALTADRYALAAQNQASAAQIQALAAQAQAESVKVQSDTAKTQADNIRLMIEMLNRKQA